MLLLLFLVRGLLRGFVRELAELVGIFLGIFLAGRFYQQFAPQFASVVGTRWAAGLSYAAILVLTLVVIALSVAVIRRFMAMTFTTWLDTLLGAAFGLLKGVFICAVLVVLMQRFVPDSPFLKEAIVPGYIETVIALARSLLPAFSETASFISG